MCRLAVLRDYVTSLVRPYWLAGEIKPTWDRIAAEWKKYKYCPKCGARLEFDLDFGRAAHGIV